jgi:hypothetical protein
MVTIMSRNESFNLRACLTSVGVEEHATVAQAIFQPNLFPYKNPNNLIPVILPIYTAYENGIVLRNVGT